MSFDNFSGAIFTPQEVFLFCAVSFLTIGTLIGVAIFGIRKISEKKAPKGKPRRPHLAPSILMGFASLIVAILVFFVIPTMIEDSRRENKQQECAEQAGYSSPADNNDPNLITSESQSAYWRCLESGTVMYAVYLPIIR